MARRPAPKRLREAFARNLVRLREARSWTQEELARRAGISRTYIGNVENCMYAASLDVIEKAAHALGVQPLEMLRPPRERKSK